MSSTPNNNDSSSTKKQTKKQFQIEWRRSKCLELYMTGASQTEIAEILQVSQGLISQDLAHIRDESREQIQNIVTHEIPLAWAKARKALQFLQREALHIWKVSTNSTQKLHALTLFEDAQQKEFDLVAGGQILDQAITFCSKKNVDAVIEQLNKEKEQRKEENEELTDTNVIQSDSNENQTAD